MLCLARALARIRTVRIVLYPLRRLFYVDWR